MFTFEELSADYRFLDDNNGIKKADKVRLSEKYSVGSIKVADIKKAILFAMRDERSSRKEFNYDDLKNFSILPVPEKTKLSEECIDFVKYYRKVYWNSILSHKLENKINLTGRDWNYIMTSYDKYVINCWKKANDIIESYEAKSNGKDDQIDKIYNTLIEKSKSFYDYYIQNVKISASDFFDSIPNRISELKSSISILTNKLDNNEFIRSSSYDDYWKIKSNLEKSKANKGRLEGILNKGKEQYIESKVTEADFQFISDMKEIATRLYNHGITEEFEIESISNDMKLFEIYVNSATVKLHGRAIIAAENSDKVSTHLRFIITER